MSSSSPEGSRRIRTYHEVGGESSLPAQVAAQHERLLDRLRTIDAVVPVLSGKGGVGKSAITANLAAALSRRGRAVGALDADLNGPSLARMLSASGPLQDAADGVGPALGVGGIPLVSMDLLQRDAAPLRWREPGAGGFIWQSTLETGVLREFLSDVRWGELDVLLVDVPPGTDKIRRLLELVPEPALVLLVTTPSPTTRGVVERSARLLADAGVPRVGLVSNMTEHVCAGCGRRSPLFPGRDPAEDAAALGLPLLATVPFDARLAEGTDAGRPPAGGEAPGPAAEAIGALARRIEETLFGGGDR